MKPQLINTVDQKILNFIRSKKIIEIGDKILIALSGGPDSVFALKFFVKYKRKFKSEIAAMHVNHMIRGKEADGDQLFAENLCRELGVDFYCSRINVPEYAKKNKISVEEAARILRYGELTAKAAELDFDKVVTAHNLGDNAETVLLNLFSGTGISGLSGIPVKRDKFIRPLLAVSKEEIMNYLKDTRTEFRIDSSNLKNDFRRNYLRNKIFPLIKQNLNPSFEEALLRSSVNLAGSLKFIDEAISLMSRKYLKIKDDSVGINLALFNSEYSDLAGELMRRIMKNKFSHDFSYPDYQKLVSLITNQKGRKIKFAGNLSAVKEVNSIVILTGSEQKAIRESEIRVGGKLRFGGKTIAISAVDASKIRFLPGGNAEFLDADKLDDIFIFRRWKSGDRFIPLGMKNFKKVSDFLNDRKITAVDKNEQFVLLNGNRIVWVAGLRIDDRFKIGPKTERAYKIWIK